MDTEVSPYLLLMAPVAVGVIWAVDRYGFRAASPRPDAPRWAEAQGLIAFFVWFLLQLLFATLWAILGLDQRSATVQSAGLAGVLLFSLAFAVVVARSAGQGTGALAWVRGPLRNYPWLLVVLVPALVVLNLLAHGWNSWLESAGIAVEEQELIQQFREWLRAGETPQIVCFAVNAIVLAPLGEEVVFRGLLFRALEARRGFWPAAVFSSLLFGVVHWVPAGLLPLAAVGMFLCYLLSRTGSLLVAVTFHALFNATTVVVVWVQATSGA